MENIKFNITNSDFNNFLSIIEELDKISHKIKIKFLNKAIVLYSIVVDNENEQVQKQKVVLMRMFILNRAELFTEQPSDLILTWNIVHSSEFIKQISFLKKSDNILCEMIYLEETGLISTVTLNDGILEITAVAGDDREIKDLAIENIKTKMDIRNADWKFNLNQDMFDKIKKLSNFDKKALVRMYIEDNVVKIYHSNWNIKVDTIPQSNSSIVSVDKIYLDKILYHNSDIVTIGVFDSYIIVDEKKSMLMFAQDLSD